MYNIKNSNNIHTEKDRINKERTPKKENKKLFKAVGTKISIGMARDELKDIWCWKFCISIEI